MSPLKPLEVLVVDDNPGDVCLIEEALRDGVMPSRLHSAKDGEEALAFLKGEAPFAGAPRPDLVLLDLTMPRMDGREALGHMRARWPHLPVILSSGYSEQAGSLDLGGPGAYLPKPYRVVDLREALARALGR